MAVKTKARLSDMELLNRVPLAERMADPAQWVGECLEAVDLKLDPVIHESLTHGKQVLRYNVIARRFSAPSRPLGVLSCSFVRDLAKMNPLRAIAAIHLPRDRR